MEPDSRKKDKGIECTSLEEIKIAIKNIGIFPIVLGVGPPVAGQHYERYFVHKKDDIKGQAERAFDASNSVSFAASVRGRVTVKKLLQEG